MFSIEFSGHLSVPCVRPILSFSFGCSSAQTPYLCGILRFSNGSSQSMCPFLFSGFSRIFFFLFLPKRTAEKEPKRALPCSQRTMELSQPKGNDREKKYKKREPRTGSKAHTRFSICFCFRIILFVPFRII